MPAGNTAEQKERDIALVPAAGRSHGRRQSARLPQEHLILEVAAVVRETLAADFPDRPGLRGQCRRAAILCDLMLTGLSMHLGVSSTVRVGYVRNPHGAADRWGHHWVLARPAHSAGPAYLLDVTLTQFATAIDEVPEVVWGPYRTTMRRYGYGVSGTSLYLYEPGEVSGERVRRVAARVADRLGVEPRVPGIYLSA